MTLEGPKSATLNYVEWYDPEQSYYNNGMAKEIWFHFVCITVVNAGCLLTTVFQLMGYTQLCNSLFRLLVQTNVSNIVEASRCMPTTNEL